MSVPVAMSDDQGPVLLSLYDRALPQVYGYLVSRCGSSAIAEDLTSETFMAAVDAVQRRAVPTMTIGWLVGVARHKLVDHWRAQAREERGLALVETPGELDMWDAHIETLRAQEVLMGLEAHHRGVLTLRYVDGLAVPDVARYIGRTVHATEALLVRARAQFRRAYGDRGLDGR